MTVRVTDEARRREPLDPNSRFLLHLATAAPSRAFPGPKFSPGEFPETTQQPARRPAEDEPAPPMLEDADGDA